MLKLTLWPPLRALTDHNVDFLHLPTTQNAEGDRRSYRIAREQAEQIVQLAQGLTIEGDQRITEHESALFSGAVRLHRCNQQTRFLVQLLAQIGRQFYG